MSFVRHMLQHWYLKGHDKTELEYGKVKEILEYKWSEYV